MPHSISLRSALATTALVALAFFLLMLAKAG